MIAVLLLVLAARLFKSGDNKARALALEKIGTWTLIVCLFVLFALGAAYAHYDSVYESANTSMEVARIVECSYPAEHDPRQVDAAMAEAASEAERATTMKMYAVWAMMSVLAL